MAVSNLRPNNPSEGTGPYREVARTSTVVAANTTTSLYTAPADIKLASWQIAVVQTTLDNIANYIDGTFYIGPDGAGIAPSTTAFSAQGAYTTYGRGGQFGTSVGMTPRSSTITYGSQARSFSLHQFGIRAGDKLWVRHTATNSPGTITYYLTVVEYL